MNNKDFLLLMAIGDAFGMKYEFVAHPPATAAGFFYERHPALESYQPGRYTDDTQMSLAITELLIGRVPSLSTINATDFIEAWLKTFCRDPRVGYSKRIFAALSESMDAAAFAEKVAPPTSVAGGAAMRTGPIGLLADVNEVKRIATLQAKITHDSTTGANSALAVSLTVHFLHHGGAKENLDEFLAQHIGADWNSKENGYSDDPSNGLRIATQALNALRKSATLSEVLLNAVNQDEIADTDTICAIAMIMASRCPEIKNDLPASLYDGLENGSFGADHLKKIDRKIEKLFPASEFYKNTNPPPPQRKTDFHP